MVAPLRVCSIGQGPAVGQAESIGRRLHAGDSPRGSFNQGPE